MRRRDWIIGAGGLIVSRYSRAQIGQVPTYTVPGGASYTGPGDFAAAAGAYMLRGYSSATANATQCINLRRSSDNATQDFGLVNGSLNQAAIATFGGTNVTGAGSIVGTTLTLTGGVIGGQVTGGTVASGTLIIGGASPTWTVNISQTVASATLAVANALFVTEVYDQTGGGNPAVQATAGNQPYLALNAVNSQAAIFFPNNSAFRLQAASLANPWANGGWAVNTFLIETHPTLSNLLFSENTNAEPSLTANTSGALIWTQVASTSSGTWTTAFDLSAASAYVVDVSYSQSSVANNPIITVNGSVESTTNTNPVGTITSATGVCLGNTPSASRSVPAFHTEWIFFGSIPSSVNQESIRQNSGAYYGIAVS